MTPPELGGRPNRTTTGWRVAQGIGTPIAVVLAALGLNRWWFFVSFMTTAGQAGSDRESQALVMLGFGLWFVLWWAAAILIMVVWGLRPLVTKIVLGVSLVLTLAAVVVPFV